MLQLKLSWPTPRNGTAKPTGPFKTEKKKKYKILKKIKISFKDKLKLIKQQTNNNNNKQKNQTIIIINR